MTIEALREEIDLIDSELSALLEKRLEAAEKIGALKKEKGIIIENKEREREVLSKVCVAPYSAEKREVYEKIIEACKSVQGELK